MNLMFKAEINSDKVKELTLAKIRDCSTNQNSYKRKRLLLAAVITCLLIFGTVGAVKLFDWRYLVNGEIQQGDFGDKVIIGGDYAAMEPGISGDTADEANMYKFSNPAKIPEAGQLRLFGSWSEDKSWLSLANDLGADTSTDLREIRKLCENAEIKILLPEAVTDEFAVKSSCIKFYAKEDQISGSELLYSSFGSMSEEMLFRLPEGYDKFVRGTYIDFQSPSGEDFVFTSSLAQTSTQAYGGSGSAIIEQLEIEGFDEAVYVYDDDTANLYCWKETPAVNTVALEEFARGKFPEGSFMEKRSSLPAETYSWQNYSIRSKDMGRDELIEVMKSINFN